MTEEEWDGSPTAGRMLHTVHRHARPDDRLLRRRFRLFACYLLRPLARFAPDGGFLAAVDAAERHQLGQARWADVTALIRAAQVGLPAFVPHDERTTDWEALNGLSALVADQPLQGATAAVAAATAAAVLTAEQPGWEVDDRDARNRKSRGFGGLIREMFGHPFRPVRFDPWRTTGAVALAEVVFRSGDFATLPILADALEEAGCDVPDVLVHCRDPEAIHVRGCWVVDGVLGKG